MIVNNNRHRIEELVRKGYKRIRLLNKAAIGSGFFMGPTFLLTGLLFRINGSVEYVVLCDILIGLGSIFTILFFCMIYDYTSKERGFKNMISFSHKKGLSLVWIYIECRKAHANEVPINEIINIPGMYFHVHLHFENKTKTKVWLSSEEATELLYLTAKEFKNISTGWSKDLYRQWKKDPQSLIQNPVKGNKAKITIVNARS